MRARTLALHSAPRPAPVCCRLFTGGVSPSSGAEVDLASALASVEGTLAKLATLNASADCAPVGAEGPPLQGRGPAAPALNTPRAGQPLLPSTVPRSRAYPSPEPCSSRIFRGGSPGQSNSCREVNHPGDAAYSPWRALAPI